jgi:hypothetical protein
MVKTLRLAAMISSLLLSCASCDVLFNGVFPPSIGQVTARTDLSASIAATPASSFSLSTVSAGGSEYVILFTSTPFDSSRPHLLILDSHLKVLNTFSIGDLAAISAGPQLNGNFTMTDVNGFVVIGNMRFNPQPSGFVLDTSYPSISLFGPSVSGLPSHPYNETNFRVNGPNLLYDEYSAAWVLTTPPPPPTFTVPLGVPNPPAQFLRLQNVFADQDNAATPDLFVFQDDSSQRTFLLTIPKTDIDIGLSNISSVPPDVFTYYGASVVTKSNLNSQALAFSRAGIIAYDFQSDSLVRFTLDTPDSVSSLPLKYVNGMRLAAGISGSYCVVWDPVARTLTRYEQWW